MQEREKAIKQKILESYCQAKRGSILTELRDKVGDDLVIELVDNFSGRLIYIPNKSSLKRAALPMLVRAELRGLESGSNEFKAKVKILSEYYKLTQKAVIKIDKEGVFLR